MTNIRVLTARLLKDKYQIEERVTEIMFDEGILTECAARNVLIKTEYERKAEVTGKQLLKCHLSDRFCVSVSTVEKIVAVK